MATVEVLMCSGTTKDGNACKKLAMKDGTLCAIHYRKKEGITTTRKKNVQHVQQVPIDRTVRGRGLRSQSSLPDFLIDGSLENAIRSTDRDKRSPRRPSKAKMTSAESTPLPRKPTKSPPRPVMVNAPCLNTHEPNVEHEAKPETKPERGPNHVITSPKSPKIKNIMSLAGVRRMMSPRRRAIGKRYE